MAPKHTGYDFWREVLKSPKYVAAPMVDMSELPFRMLCRKYNSQLCYTPMMHSLQFSQDFLYRKDNFSTVCEDRPLIAQFCANDPDVFTSAALLISGECDAVDLNLGCPQAIARKGHYGSFLQEDWQLIHSMIRKASADLPIPVTCKMRILPGNYKQSIEYARMLEAAGCSLITVHGRTREQKGHATGLASWDAIRAIKHNVNIPVIANGNILHFEDAANCLSYTGADAVMSAEALLQNPALFSGLNLPVSQIVSEYLHLAEKYDTHVRFARNHLFRLLYLCIHHKPEMQEILSSARKISDFYSVLDILKEIPAEHSNELQTQPHQKLDASENLVYLFDKNGNKHDTRNQTQSGTIAMDIVDCDKRGSTIVDSTNEFVNDVENMGNEPMYLSKGDVAHKHPIWICHSRPRISENEANRGCYRKYFNSPPESVAEASPEEHLSKKKMRKIKKWEHVLSLAKSKRKLKKERKKMKIAEMRKQLPEKPPVDFSSVSNEKKLTKQQQKQVVRERLLNAQGTAPKICINLGFSSVMDTKELTKLATQLRRLYGSNRKSENPLHLYFCNFNSEDPLYKICLDKNDGFSSYVVDVSPQKPEDLFDVTDLVYLSPDSDNVLQCLDSSKIYVIGGIVDATVKKGISLSHAKSFNITTARLPIEEHLVKSSDKPGSLVLTVNQVFDIMLKYYETKDWVAALSANVPPRKGYRAPLKKEVDNDFCVSDLPDSEIVRHSVSNALS